MRDLTEEELELSPDWATHYMVDTDNSIVYESENLCWWPPLKEPLTNKDIEDGAREIPRKPFDISEHEFSDENFKGAAYIDTDGDLVIGASEHEIPCFCASKQDAIAIAKALGVTGEDLS